MDQSAATPTTGDEPPEALGPGPTGGRAATEAALEAAAMTLLWRDGVLAGLNLREVANEAGVNRGLVYHYYGSRGKLLRKALLRRGEATRAELAASHQLPFRTRWRRFFQTTVDHPEPVALSTLLILDGSEPIRSMPMREQTQEGLQRSVEDGDIDPDIDLVALHTILVTATYGYSLYRESFAREFGVNVEDLDARVSSLLYDRLVDAVAPSRSKGRRPK